MVSLAGVPSFSERGTDIETRLINTTEELKLKGATRNGVKREGEKHIIGTHVSAVWGCSACDVTSSALCHHPLSVDMSRSRLARDSTTKRGTHFPATREIFFR
ncbi:hypothetical protein ALC53_04525 [Atta colombica]|uniref:Uncharacterized protein n=1 Tax=Atta colombica TaxID=520822 RepID=A0A195BLV3_9HYME|nr:hypothetical protein ALC53_04525 [Atta colombica]